MARRYRTNRAGTVTAAECTLCSSAAGRTMLLPISDFQKDSSSSLGVQGRCRDCRRGLARTRNGRIRRMLHDARWNALNAGRACTITYDDIDRAFRGTCPVTGLPFDMECTVYAGRMINMNAPSLDRKDSSKGYVAGNIQVVLAWVNNAKSNQSQRKFNGKLRGGKVKQVRHVLPWQRRNRRGGLIRI